MTGEQPSPEPELGQYASLRDEVLYRMATDGWANESSGEVAAPVGWFARISNAEVELPDIIEAFGERMEALGFTNTERLVGNFLLIEQEQGVIQVEHYHTEDDVTAAFDDRERRYTFWLETREPKGGDDDSSRTE